jgi:hypothetical protein
MTLDRLCIVVNYERMQLELKVLVKEFILNFFLDNDIRHFKLDKSITGKNEIIVIPSFSDGNRFLQYVHDRKLGFPRETTALNETGWMGPPTCHSVTSYNDVDGLHTYVCKGDDLSGLCGHMVKGVTYHGAWLHDEPKARYLGNPARLWFVGDSTNVYDCVRQLRYDLRRDRKVSDTPLTLETCLVPTIARLGKRTKLCIMTHRGDFFTITSKGIITVGEYSDEEATLKAAVFEWRKFKHGFTEADIVGIRHELDPLETAFRHAAHEAIIDRNKRGWI